MSSAAYAVGALDQFLSRVGDDLPFGTLPWLIAGPRNFFKVLVQGQVVPNRVLTWLEDVTIEKGLSYLPTRLRLVTIVSIRVSDEGVDAVQSQLLLRNTRDCLCNHLRVAVLRFDVLVLI